MLAYQRSSDLSSSPRYFMRPLRGAVLSRQQTDSELTHFSVVASAVVFVQRTCRHS